MNKGKWYWVVFLALIVLVAGEYLSGFLTLLFLRLDTGLLRWNTYLGYLRALNQPELQPYLGRVKVGGYIGFGLSALLWLLAVYSVTRKKTPSIHGDARFARGGDLGRQGMFKRTDNGILVGKFKGELVRLSGQQFVILAAPTRSAKVWE